MIHILCPLSGDHHSSLPQPSRRNRKLFPAAFISFFSGAFVFYSTTFFFDAPLFTRLAVGRLMWCSGIQLSS